MRGVNKVILVGNLGKDPEIHVLEGNIMVARFSLATTEVYRDKAGKPISQTDWHTVVLWRGLAELAQKHLHKGSMVYVEGKIRNRNWEDKEGNKRYAHEVLGENILLLDKKDDAANHIAPQNSDAFSSTNPNQHEDNDKLPFA
jgi:single-strand DNA-binding protein